MPSSNTTARFLVCTLLLAAACQDDAAPLPVPDPQDGSFMDFVADSFIVMPSLKGEDGLLRMTHKAKHVVWHFRSNQQRGCWVEQVSALRPDVKVEAAWPEAVSDCHTASSVVYDRYSGDFYFIGDDGLYRYDADSAKVAQLLDKPGRWLGVFKDWIIDLFGGS